MTIHVLYFAALREAVGMAKEEVILADGLTVASLRQRLLARGGTWAALAEGRSLQVAVNKRMATPQTALQDGDEVAFFPPVTGG